MYYSFVLISSPDICEGAQFKRHKMFFPTMPHGIENEIVDVIAINCNSRHDIPGMISRISATYLEMQPNEENIKTAVWSSACRAVLMEDAFGTQPSQEVIDLLKHYDIDVNDYNCIYIPLAGPVLTMMERHVSSKMLSR